MDWHGIGNGGVPIKDLYGPPFQYASRGAVDLEFKGKIRSRVNLFRQDIVRRNKGPVDGPGHPGCCFLFFFHLSTSYINCFHDTLTRGIYPARDSGMSSKKRKPALMPAPSIS
jgi:hypothetical protein